MPHHFLELVEAAVARCDDEEDILDHEQRVAVGDDRVVPASDGRDSG